MFRQPEEGVCLVCFCRYIAANYYFQNETKGWPLLWIGHSGNSRLEIS